MALQSNNRDADPKIEKYRRTLEENPNSRYFAPLADALRKQGDLREAIRTAEDGVKRNPRYESGLIVLAKAYLDNEQYEQSLEKFLLVTRMNPENVNAQKAIAEIYDKMGYHRQAMQAYRTVTILDPRDKKAVERLALLEATAPAEDAPAQETVPLKQDKKEIEGEEHHRPNEGGAEEVHSTTKDHLEKEKPADMSVVQEDEKTEEISSMDEFFPEPVPAREENVNEKQAVPLDNVVISEPGKGRIKPLLQKPSLETAPNSINHVNEKEAQHEDKDRQDAWKSRFPEPVIPEKDEQEKEKAKKDQQEEQEPQEVPASEIKKAAPEKVEEQALDNFFAHAKPEKLSMLSEETHSDESSPFEPVSTPRFQVKIEKSTGGKMFWNQGNYREALKMIARNLWEAPYDQELREEFLQACRAMDRAPEAVLDEVIVIEDEKRAERQSKEEAEKSAEPEADEPKDETTETEEKYCEEHLESKQKIQTLKAYLSKIRQDKEKMP